MGAVATFVYTDWIARYPEFTGTVNPTLASVLFNEATVYLRNDGGGPVSSVAVQTMLLYKLTAHIAQLGFGSSQQAVGPLVGRITDAAEGSVHVSVDTGEPTPGTAAWYMQTKYGADYWAATAVYRTATIRAPARRNFNPWPGGGC